MKNDVSYGKYIDSGSGAMRYSADSDVDQQPSDDSDVSAAPRSRKGASKASRSRGPKVRTLNRWSQDEHERLAFLVAKWGSEKNWAKVAEEMPGRTGKQCRERWLNHMKPGIIKGNWSFEEEFLLAQCHAVVGSHWSKMTKRLPGRTENSIKNFWNATLRSKAPHKRRGVLWLYMQQQTCQEGENVDAFLVAVTRLYETQELPGPWAQLMDDGRLTDRTLRAVLRAEKDFLENPDAELHPLALPHPTHGLAAIADADATAAGTAAAAAAGADADAGAGAGLEGPSAAQGTTASAAGPAPAAGGGSGSFQPVSPLPAPGLTPRCPGVDNPQAGSGRSSGVPCAAAFDGLGMRALGGLALPPEVLAALGPQEAWAGLTSAQVPAGLAYGAAPGSMEPLMPTMGMNSDMHPSGHQPAGQGAFGGAMGGALAPGHDAIWTCLPSLRGLCNTGFGAGATPAAGSFTPHAAADPLKLLEPYGALTGHHHSSSVSMHTRPDSALEMEHPAQRQPAPAAAAADSQGISRHSSSRPGSSMGTHVMLPASMTPPGELAAISAAFQQHRQSLAALQGTAGQQGQYSPDDVTGHHHHMSSSALTHAWMRMGANHHQPAAAAGQHTGQDMVRSGDSSCHQAPSERGSSPADSATHSELAYGAAGHQQQHAGAHMHSQGMTQAAWEGAADGSLQQQQEHMLSHAAPGGHPAPTDGLEQLCSVLSAPMSIASLKHAHSSTQSPFARHASTSWDTEGAAEAAAAAASLQNLQQGHGRPVLQHETEPPQQPPAGRHALQLGPLTGPTAAGLFSPRSVDSPMTGALQQLLDSAAAHACIRAQDICAWLASANTGQLPAQLRPQQQDNRADQAATDMLHALGQSVLPAREDSSNVNSTNSTSGGAQEAHACSILETLLGPRHSAQLSDMLLSPAGLFSTAALLQGSLPPTPAAGHTGAAAALQPSGLGIKRERSLPEAQEELLIEQPGSKMPRVF